MLRLSTPPGIPLETGRTLDLHAGGAESNVAATLAQLGHRAAWCSRLPQLPTGRFIANALRQRGVDLSLVTWCQSGRVGTYYVELNQPPTPVQVTYDRADSCAARLTPENLPLAELLNTRLLHLTGITPALSPTACAATRRLTDAARHNAIPFSFDINYRQKLWPPDAAKAALTQLAHQAEILLVAAADAATLFGISGPPERVATDLATLLSHAISSSPSARPVSSPAAPATSSHSRPTRLPLSTVSAPATPWQPARSTAG